MNEFVVVYSAELMRRLKSRPFQIGLLIGIVGIIAFLKMPSLLGGAFNGHDTRIVLAGDPTLTARAKAVLPKAYTVVAVTPETGAPTAATLKSRDVDAWVAIAESKTLRVTVYAQDPGKDWASIGEALAPLNFELATDLSQARVKSLLNVPVDIKAVGSHFADAKAADAAQGVAFTMLFFLYMLILVNSQLVMSAVAEEKTSRIAELLISSISPVPLLYGKIAVATTLALLQMVIWIGVGILLGNGAGSAGTSSSHGFDLSGILAGAVTPLEAISFFVLFILGFLQLSTMFAGLGSLINRTEDIGSISMPLVIPVVGALFIAMAALGMPNAPWVVATSFVPILAPFVMFARIAVSDVPIWQIVTCVAINALALWAIALLAGKLYRVGMLLYGRAPSLKQVWQVMRT
ncbi:MAG: ABC transporter permease [Candidatus Eremiobacteraeota bacterium]|nr:ABC transporter permease [Candidatus Eremiobacteraeota bacterium]